MERLAHRTVSVVFVRFVVDAARRAGIDCAELLRVLGLEPGILQLSDAAVPGAVFAQAWAEAARRSGDPAFGLHAGEQMHVGAFELLDYVAMSAPTFGEALMRLVRYYRIMNDIVELSIETDGDDLHFIHRGPGPAIEPMRHAWDAFVAIIVVRARAAFGPDWAPRAVTSVHGPPPDLREHERLLRAPLSFHQATNELVFDARMASLPLPSADPALSRLITRLADELLTRTPDPQDLVGRVRRVVRERLRGCDVTLEEVAARLHVSARSLQRKLAESGTAFHQLLDEERHQQALHYLQASRIAIGEIAFLLGYSQPHAFHRAFRRWTGMTPASYRETAKVAG